MRSMRRDLKAMSVVPSKDPRPTSKMLLLVRLHCQWSVPRRPSATCTDVCGNETACRSGFCVLLHILKGVTGFTLYLIVVIICYVPLVVSKPIFPPCRELLRENGPEMKCNFCEVSSGNRTTSDPSEIAKGITQILMLLKHWNLRVQRRL